MELIFISLVILQNIVKVGILCDERVARILPDSLQLFLLMVWREWDFFLLSSLLPPPQGNFPPFQV